MATVALADTADPQIIEDDDTYVSSARTQPTRAVLPAIDDASGATVAVGYEIRFQATAGSVIRVETVDGRLVGIVPGRGSAVVVAEAGAQESEADFWRFQVLPQAPATTLAGAAGTDSAIIDAISAILINAGLALAE